MPSDDYDGDDGVVKMIMRTEIVIMTMIMTMIMIMITITGDEHVVGVADL